MLLEVMSPFPIPLVSFIEDNITVGILDRGGASGTKLRIHKLFELVAVAVEFSKRHIYAYTYTRDPGPGKEGACLWTWEECVMGPREEEGRGKEA